MTKTMQDVWDEAAAEFEEMVTAACECPTLEPGEEPDDWTHYGPHHAEDVFGNLDDCSADPDEGVNFAYGKLYGILDAASAAGVTIRQTFPRLADEDADA